MSDSVDRFVETVSRHSKLLIVAILLVTVVMGAGMGQVSQESSLDQFSFGSDAEDAQAYVTTNFSTQENVTRVQVVFREEGEDVLTKEALVRDIELQQSFRQDEEINATLAPGGMAGLSNVVAQTVIAQEQGENDGPSNGVDATLEEQRRALVAMDEEEVDAVLAQLLAEDGANSRAFAFVPRDFEAGSTSADARTMFVTQRTDEGVGPQ